MNAQSILTFILRLGALKTLPRTGWRLRGVRDGESVADHGYRVSHLAMLLADAMAERGTELDVTRVLRMAQLHEIGEALIGDVAQSAESPFPRAAKRRAEHAAVQTLTGSLGPLGPRYRQLWEEFDEGRSPEARLVRAADKLEMLIQAREYERTGYRTLGDFWRFTDNRTAFASFPLVQEIVALLEAERRGLPGAGEGASG